LFWFRCSAQFARLIDVPAKSNTRRSHATLIVVLLLFFAASAALLLYAVMQWNAKAKARNLKNPVPATAEALAAGKEIYQQHCQRCHGVNGDGKGEKAAELSVAPGNFTDAAKMSGLTDGELFWEITEGRRPMPAFADKLSEQERWQVVDYIRTFAAGPTTPQPAATLQATKSIQP
jgi:mono/diheme cytochrome c family protein